MTELPTVPETLWFPEGVVGTDERKLVTVTYGSWALPLVILVLAVITELSLSKKR